MKSKSQTGFVLILIAAIFSLLLTIINAINPFGATGFDIITILMLFGGLVLLICAFMIKLNNYKKSFSWIALIISIIMILVIVQFISGILGLIGSIISLRNK